MLIESKPVFSHDEEIAIQLEGVGVRYRMPQERIPSFKEYLIRRVKGDISYQSFWALQDVNLTVKRGEVFGIIGQNGAGKSTLLKLVARVLRPTNGRVRVWGRVAPLLELGAGFDQELTGRENIFLNGAILGFNENQMRQRFDQIVAFSGLEEFIDAPLRTYSTGMIARLGFSIATDVHPDILIVDEILGVGDAEFQTRSYERIQQFKGEGMTIFLVTHSLERVQEICTQVAWLRQGKIAAVGSAASVVARYQEETNEREGQRLVEESESQTDRWGTNKVEILQAYVSGKDGVPQTIFRTGDALQLHVDIQAAEKIINPIVGIAIFRHDGIHICGPNTQSLGITLPDFTSRGKVVYTIPQLPLMPGKFEFTIAVHNTDSTEFYQAWEHACPFRVVPGSEVTMEQYGLMTMWGNFEYFQQID